MATQGTQSTEEIPDSRLPSPFRDAATGSGRGRSWDFAHLVPMNKMAKDAFHLLACRVDDDDDVHLHHRKYLRVDEEAQHGEARRSGSFVFSLEHLPEYAPLGWRIGRGRKSAANLAVEMPLAVDDRAGVVGNHARFAWVKGTGGFFIIADNSRGPSVTLNGEALRNDRRLIPYRNTLSFGELFFTLNFVKRTPAQEEQFQVELLKFYQLVLSENAPLVLPTPSENDVMLGEWIVRNPIAKGSFGSVSIVVHSTQGRVAAAKEIWRTQRNAPNVDREIGMAKKLQSLTHKRLATPFHIEHQKLFNSVEKGRISSLLDDTWKPSPHDTTDRYVLFSPLATGSFYSLLTSRASRLTRTVLWAQILDGVAFLHENGIMHRDIKPGNLIIESYDPPSAKIADFGCAAAATSILYDRPGTIPYLAPEQTEGKYHGHTVDEWACGLVGLQLLGYRSLTDKAVDSKALEAITKWLADPARGPNDAIALCCQGFLVQEPQSRLTARGALRGALRGYDGLKHIGDEENNAQVAMLNVKRPRR